MMGNAFGPGGSIMDTNQGGQGGIKAGYLWGAQAPSGGPLNPTPTSGPQLAPGQTSITQTMPAAAPKGTADEEEAKQRLLAAQSTILGDSDQLGGTK